MTSQKLSSGDFWWIANSVPNKGKFAIPLVVGDPNVLSSAWDHPFSMYVKFSKNFAYLMNHPHMIRQICFLKSFLRALIPAKN